MQMKPHSFQCFNTFSDRQEMRHFQHCLISYISDQHMAFITGEKCIKQFRHQEELPNSRYWETLAIPYWKVHHFLLWLEAEGLTGPQGNLYILRLETINRDMRLFSETLWERKMRASLFPTVVIITCFILCISNEVMLFGNCLANFNY